MSETTRKLIEAYDDAWNRQDLAALCAFHADDIVFENHTAGERVEGAEAVRAHIGGIFERWPSLRFRGRRFYAAEDFAVSEWTATATRPGRDADRVGRCRRLPAPRREDRAQGRLLVLARTSRARLGREGAANLEAATPITAGLERAARRRDDVLDDREAETRAARGPGCVGRQKRSNSRGRSLSATPMPSSAARRTVEPPSRVTESVKVAPCPA